jgi:dienelactone hydrolase
MFSLVTELNDAEAELTYVKTLSFADTNKIGACGMSMGGAVATLFGGENTSQVNALCLWALAALMGDRLTELDFFGSAAKFQKPVLLLNGTEDRLVRIVEGGYLEKYKNAYGSNLEYVEVQGAGHGFYKCDHRIFVLDNTIRYFNKLLK